MERRLKNEKTAAGVLEEVRATELKALQISTPHVRQLVDQISKELDISFGLALRVLATKQLADYEGVPNHLAVENLARLKNIRNVA